MASSIGDLMIRVGCEISGFTSAMTDISKSLDTTADKIEDRFESLGDVGKRFGMVGLEWSAAITLPLEEMGRRALETAAQFEQTQIAFTTFLGSSAAAKETLAGLYQFAATTPFEVPGVLQAGRTLLAMGFSAKDIQPILRTLGDAASGLGVGQAGLERFVFHLGQIRALGHIDGAILREMGQNGVAAAQMLADYMGKSVPEITKMVTAKDPSLDSTTVINALMEGMNNQFGGAMTDQMQSLSGQWSNFKDQITLASVAIGNTLLPIGKELLGWASEALEKIKDLAAWFSHLPEPVQNGYIALAAFVGILGPLMTGIGGALMLIGPLAAAVGVGIGAFFGWAAAIGAAVVALVELGTWMSSHWEGIKAAFQEFRFGTVGGMVPAFNAADSKAQSDKAEDKSISEAKSTMHLGANAYKVTPEDEAWATKHKIQVDQYTAALTTLREEHKKGKVSADEVAEAEKKYQALLAAKPPKHATEAEGKTKIDHNALDSLSGAHAHEEAQLARERAKIEHDYQMAKPGSADVLGILPEEQAAREIAAAEKRKADLDKLSDDERKKTLANIEEKLKLYKNDQAGHQKLIEAKQTAEEKYAAAVEKTSFDLEIVKKQANERILQSDIHVFEEDLKAQEKSFEMALKTADLNVKAKEKELNQKIKFHEFDAQMEDKRLQFELETGQISKSQYLRMKQEQYDIAYQMEMDAIAAERALIEKEYADARSKAITPEQKQQVEASYKNRTEPLKEREQSVQMKQSGRRQDTAIGLERDRIGTMNQNFFTPFENGFSKGISNMVKGIQTFRQAWSSMATGMLSQWIDHVAQMVSQWVTAKLRELVIHATTNQAKVASDQAAALQSRSISMSQHLHEVTLAAKLAAAKTWSAVSGIPVIGPVLAPIAAAAAFAGVFAISAESGAVLPNHNTLGFLHPQEMVLPKGISVGLQNLIASGGLSNASAMMNQAQGGTMSSTALQMARNVAASGDTHHNYHGPLNYHAAPGERLSQDSFGKMFNAYVRQQNLKMA